MVEAVTLSDVMKELKEIRLEIKELKSQKELEELKEDFISDLKLYEKEEGKILTSLEELENHLENL